MTLHLISALGFFVFAGLAWLLSNNRRSVNWRTIAWGLGLQLVIGLLVFRLPGSRQVFLKLNDGVMALLEVSKAGTNFLLGPLAAGPGEPGSVGFILAFQALPIAIFFSALSAALYHLGVLQFIVRAFAKLFHRTMHISGAESLCGAANIFVGVESALVVRPYLDKMTRSELLMVLSAGMTTVASTTLGIYVLMLSKTFPQIAGHLLSASVISIPAAVVMAKLLLPETETPETLNAIPPEEEDARARNLMSAIITGANDGLKLAVGIGTLLIAGLAFVALFDKLIGWPSRWLGLSEPLSIVRILSWVFYPFAALMGIARADLMEAARLLGERVMLTEVVAYQDLATMATTGQITDPRTVVILSYALCGFAHVASVAIFVGGTSALVPSRRDDLASLGFRALLAATLATLMTGCVAGIFSDGSGVLIGQ
ncbi:MAG TPA: nucleoside transporter C-terminal domain-containing protein [Blastocatellia bacterium]|nr:nucleoside transporter C-terminal domain-containing protein [Blastocatellia bacterium]